MVTIYHNPRCRKSREALLALEEAGIKPEIRLYLQQPPDRDELQSLISKLGISAEEIVRKNESVYKEQFKGKNLSEGEWIGVLSKHPVLIERPIVIIGKDAVIGRPVERVTELLAKKKDRV